MIVSAGLCIGSSNNSKNCITLRRAIKAPVANKYTQFLTRKFSSRKTIVFNRFLSNRFHTSQIFKTKNNPINATIMEHPTNIREILTKFVIIKITMFFWLFKSFLTEKVYYSLLLGFKKVQDPLVSLWLLVAALYFQGYCQQNDPNPQFQPHPIHRLLQSHILLYLL